MPSVQLWKAAPLRSRALFCNIKATSFTLHEGEYQAVRQYAQQIDLEEADETRSQFRE